jgi:tRNA nucleotidyltransferase (CCA-adding enzyme)
MRRERKPSPGFFHRRKLARTTSTSSQWRIGRAVIEIARPDEAPDHRLGQCPLDLTTHREIIKILKAAGAKW